jgi:hypothetical protein
MTKILNIWTSSLEHGAQGVNRLDLKEWNSKFAHTTGIISAKGFNQIHFVTEKSRDFYKAGTDLFKLFCYSERFQIAQEKWFWYNPAVCGSWGNKQQGIYSVFFGVNIHYKNIIFKKYLTFSKMQQNGYVSLVLNIVLSLLPQCFA